MRGEDNNADFECMFGLIGSPHLDAGLEEMNRLFENPDFPVTQMFLTTMSILPLNPRDAPETLRNEMETNRAVVNQKPRRVRYGHISNWTSGAAPTLTQFVKRTDTGGIAARGAAISSTPERSLLSVEEVRRPFPYRPNDTDKFSLDVFSRFLWRSRMRRAAVDTRCTR